jgi:hypothetical protein
VESKFCDRDYVANNESFEKGIVERIKERVGDDPVYISLDIDVSIILLHAVVLCLNHLITGRRVKT